MVKCTNPEMVNNEVMTNVLDLSFDGFCDIAGLRCWNLVFTKKLESALKSDLNDADVRAEYQSLLDFNKVMLTARFPVRLNETDEAPQKYSPFSIIYRKWATNDGVILEYDKDNLAKLNSLDMFAIKGDISMGLRLSDFSVEMEGYFDKLFDAFKSSAIDMKSYNRCVYSDCLADINNVFYSKAEEIIFDKAFVRNCINVPFPITAALHNEKITFEA